MIGDKSYWNGGYATEAMQLIIDFMFQERGMNRIVANVLEHNKASIRMLEKCGYKIEGMMRQSVYKNGHYHNQVIMSLLREDYELLNN